ncbi:MAG: HesA/MoeB/ThiF family protein [Ruminococcaceae bacterium]|nr:HesA/MoeB/ThiF family protein [Oscillospiraceae bacterium]
MEARYERNIPSVSPEEQETLARKRVLVVGCGGLGGYIIEYLTRMGVGELTVVDGDVFETSNLNRQLLSGEAALGKPKALAAAERVRRVNPLVKVTPVQAFLDEDNADSLTAGQDLVLDALDNARARLVLEDACARQDVTIVHGAIHGWTMQATLARPGAGTLHQLYGRDYAPRDKTSLPFTPPLCAAVQAAEAVKLLCNRPSSLDGNLLLADLLRMDWELIML